jgi:hypothetical protein
VQIFRALATIPANIGHVEEGHGDADPVLEHTGDGRGLLRMSDCEIAFSTLTLVFRAVNPCFNDCTINSGHVEESYSDVSPVFEHTGGGRGLRWQSGEAALC